MDSNCVRRIQCVGRLRFKFNPFLCGLMTMTIMHFTWDRFWLNTQSMCCRRVLYICVICHGRWKLQQKNEWIICLTKFRSDRFKYTNKQMIWHDMTAVMKTVKIMLSAKKYTPHIDTNDDDDADAGDENDWFIIGIWDVDPIHIHIHITATIWWHFGIKYEFFICTRTWFFFGVFCWHNGNANRAQRRRS